MAAPLKATFSSFRKREPRGVILRATITHFVLALALIATIVAIFWVYRGGPADDPLASSMRGLSLLGASLVWAVLYSLVTASYEAACLRQILRSETAGFAGFSLGGDTWRVWAGHWLWLLFAFAAWIGVFAFSALIVAVLNFQANTPEDTMWVGWAAIGLWLATIAPFGLRVSAGNAASVAKRRFGYFDGWAVSRDRFRTLFGSFLALWLIWVAIWFALFVGGAYLNGLIADDVAQSALYDQLMTFDLLISISVANLVLTFLSAGVNARAVITAGEEGKITGVSADVASVFD